MTSRCRAALSLVVLSGGAAPAVAQTDLLPDIIVRQQDLYDNAIVTQGSSVFLRLSNGTPNIGLGKLYLYGVTPDNGDGTQDVRQRIYRTDGSFWERTAGEFVYHPFHNHIHFNNWAHYRLREVLPGDGVGDIVAQGEKVSFCILDLRIYDNSLPNFDPDGEFRSCNSTTQGLSVGWMDIYSKDLEGQDINITGVPFGTYWLESVVDPNDHVLESDETNNVARIKVQYGYTGEVQPDAYEPNANTAEVLAQGMGVDDSPNIGPAGPFTQIDNLTIHEGSDADVFRFYVGVAQIPFLERVSIEFENFISNLKLEVMDANGTVLRSSNTTQNSESLSLSGLPRGFYFARVTSANAAISNAYTLKIRPPQSANAPALSVIDPPAGNVDLDHGVDTYTTTWNVSDSDAGDETWVTVYLNTAPAFDGNEIKIPVSIHTPGVTGFHVINTAYAQPDTTYYVGLKATDGGLVTSAWSQGTITLHDHSHECHADFNDDGTVDAFDYDDFVNAFFSNDMSADINHDDTLDAFDYDDFVDQFFGGC